MKTSASNRKITFNGAGYLIGSVMIILIAILEFFLTENFVISLSSIPIGVTMGIILEQLFQGKTSPVSSKLTAWLFIILFLGMLAFISIFLLW